MWHEEAKASYCPNNKAYNDVSSQQECQQRCIGNVECVGIIYSHKFTRFCYLCKEDSLTTARSEYDFYRRPGIVAVWLLNTHIVSFINILAKLVEKATSNFFLLHAQKTVVDVCTDGKQNHGETGIDCGGPCNACPTCEDDIQNQGETDVDCGGPCNTCPTCEDNIQNQGETGVDCGGTCATNCQGM